MRRYLLCLALLALPAWATAAEPYRGRRPTERPISVGELTPTPEMWFYEQAQRDYQDPRVAIRRKAEYEARTRQRILASQQWFGYSASRPYTTSEYQFGPPSAMWGSNSNNPFLWRGYAPGTVIIESGSNPFPTYR